MYYNISYNNTSNENHPFMPNYFALPYIPKVHKRKGNQTEYNMQ